MDEQNIGLSVGIVAIFKDVKSQRALSIKCLVGAAEILKCQILVGSHVNLRKDQWLPLWNELPQEAVSVFSLECSTEDG